MDIQTYHLAGDAVTGAEIVFQVSPPWVSAQDAEPDPVVLLRYHGNAWEELPAEFLGTRDGFLQFRARTPGFSLLAIGVNLTSETPETAATTTTVPVRIPGGTPIPSASPPPRWSRRDLNHPLPPFPCSTP